MHYEPERNCPVCGIINILSLAAVQALNWEKEVIGYTCKECGITFNKEYVLNELK